VDHRRNNSREDSLPDKPTAPPRVAEANAPAPFIYFDIVPNFGFNVGVANLTLEAVRFTTETLGKVSGERVAVAHLRTSIEGLRQLKAAIEGIEAIIQRPSDGRKN
jgi:hypothetical protein